MMSRDAEEASAQATNSIVQGAGQMITAGAALVPLFPGGGKTTPPVVGKTTPPVVDKKLDGVSKFEDFNALSEYEKRIKYPFMYEYPGKKGS